MQEVIKKGSKEENKEGMMMQVIEEVTKEGII